MPMPDILASPYFCALNAAVWQRIADMHALAAGTAPTPGHLIFVRRARDAALDKVRFWADAEQRVSRG